VRAPRDVPDVDLFEALFGYVHSVVTWLEARRGVDAGVVGFGFERDVCVGVDDLDLCVGDERALLVGDRAGDRGGFCLGIGRATKREKGKEQQRGESEKQPQRRAKYFAEERLSSPSCGPAWGTVSPATRHFPLIAAFVAEPQDTTAPRSIPCVLLVKLQTWPDVRTGALVNIA
jgi:hypothetical protein